MKEINKLRKLKKVERLIMEATECCQDVLNTDIEKCDFTQSVIDNLRSALYRCKQKQALINQKIYK